MNKLITVLAIGAFGLTSLQAFADVRPEQIQQLTAQGTIQDLQRLNQAALDLHPNAHIQDTDLDHEHGRYIYELELRDAQGVEWDVAFDAATGQLLTNQQDD